MLIVFNDMCWFQKTIYSARLDQPIERLIFKAGEGGGVTLIISCR